MTRSEFLQELRQALGNDLSGSIVQENAAFYDQYITDEVSKGKSEAEVIQMLGDPWVLARTVIDAQNGTDKETVYEAGGKNSYAGHESGREQARDRGQGSQMHIFGFDLWWKKLLLVLAIVMVIVAVFAIVTGLIRILAPLLVPILILMVIVRAIGNRRGK